MLERLAFGSNAFTNGRWNLEDAMRAIARAGYAGVNVLADSPLLWPLELTRARLKSIRDVLRETGLVVSSINGFTAAGHYGSRTTPPGQDFGPSFSDKDPGLRAYKVTYTRQVIDLAVQLDTTNISISSGYPPECVDPDEAWQWMKESMEEALEYAREKGVFLNIESEPRLLISNANDSARLLRELPHPNLGVNLDIGHVFVCKEDVPEQIRRFGSKIHGADVEDIGLDENGEPVHLHLVPGEGVMPLEDIFLAFREIGFEEKGYYTVELYSQSHRPVTVARESMRYFRKLEKKLRGGQT